MRLDDPETVVRRAMAVAYPTAAALLPSRDDAADVTQDVALDVLRSVARLRDQEAFEAWVHKIAVRHALRHLRRRSREPAMLPVAMADALERDADDSCDRDLVIAARSALAAAFVGLSPRQRAALALRYVHGLTDRQIAEALDCRRGTVNALLSRARQSLRAAPEIVDLRAALVERGGS